jgi:ATP-dependent Lhr-like helicase
VYDLAVQQELKPDTGVPGTGSTTVASCTGEASAAGPGGWCPSKVHSAIDIARPALSSHTFTPRCAGSAKLGEPTRRSAAAGPRSAKASYAHAAPTGSGKTLAAFLTAIDDLVQGAPLPDEVRVKSRR